MKKLLIAFACIVGVFASQVAMANPYKLNENAVDQNFASATEITLDQMAVDNLAALNLSGVAPTDGEVTLGGFLVRAFFCSSFAVHRSYTGTKGLWWKYFLCGIVGGIDFWYAVFKGQEALDNFQGNPHWIVWTKKGHQ